VARLVRNCEIGLNKSGQKKNSYELPIFCRAGHPRNRKDWYACEIGLKEARPKKNTYELPMLWEGGRPRSGRDRYTCAIGLNDTTLRNSGAWMSVKKVCTPIL
jgi:hypothetical protein